MIRTLPPLEAYKYQRDFRNYYALSTADVADRRENDEIEAEETRNRLMDFIRDRIPIRYSPTLLTFPGPEWHFPQKFMKTYPYGSLIGLERSGHVWPDVVRNTRLVTDSTFGSTPIKETYPLKLQYDLTGNTMFQDIGWLAQRTNDGRVTLIHDRLSIFLRACGAQVSGYARALRDHWNRHYRVADVIFADFCSALNDNEIIPALQNMHHAINHGKSSAICAVTVMNGRELPTDELATHMVKSEMAYVKYSMHNSTLSKQEQKSEQARIARTNVIQDLLTSERAVFTVHDSRTYRSRGLQRGANMLTVIGMLHRR